MKKTIEKKETDIKIIIPEGSGIHILAWIIVALLALTIFGYFGYISYSSYQDELLIEAYTIGYNQCGLDLSQFTIDQLTTNGYLNLNISGQVVTLVPVQPN